MKRELDVIEETKQSNKTQKTLPPYENLIDALKAFSSDINSLEKLQQLQEAIRPVVENKEQGKSLVDALNEVVKETRIVQNIEKTIGNTDVCPSVLRLLSLAYQYGIGIEWNNEKALEYLIKAADAGDPKALCEIGVYYQNGIGVEVDEEKAFEYFIKAADAGEPLAACKVGAYYSEKQDYENAKKYYQIAVEKNIPGAIIQLGNLHSKCNEPKEAFKCWMKATTYEGNHLQDAMYNVGYCFEKGYGVKRNVDQAIVWYHEASFYGHQVATVSFNRLLQKRYESHRHYILDKREETKDLPLAEKCKRYVDEANTTNKPIASKIALYEFIDSIKDGNALLNMLINMPKIGLGTSKIDGNLMNALRNHSDPNISRRVASPLRTVTQRDKETGEITKTELKPVKTSDERLMEEIPYVLAEALKIQSGLRKEYSKATESVTRWRGNNKGAETSLPLPLQLKVLSYLSPPALPLNEIIENRSIDWKGLSERKKFIDGLHEQSGKIDKMKEIINDKEGKIEPLKVFGKEIYKTQKPEIKPVAQEIFEIWEAKDRPKAVEKLEKNHRELLTNRDQEIDTWVEKMQEKKEIQKETQGINK